MISVKIPGFGQLKLENIVLDYNGTLAVDGNLLPGVKDTLKALSEKLDVYVVTADTFGRAHNRLDGIKCQLTVLGAGRQDQAKLDVVNTLGPEKTVSIGNGRNDALMLKASALGIAVILREGAFTGSLNAADVVFTDIVSALELLVHPLRLTATLRS